MRARRFVFLAPVLATVAVLTLMPRTATAQRTDLTVAGLPIAMVTATPADFGAGAAMLGTTTFNVNSTFGFLPRTATVLIECASPCPTSGTGAVGFLQWRRDDQASWTTLTENFVEVESYEYGWFGSGGWSRSLEWRYVLDWSATPPNPGTEFRVNYQLVVSQ